MEFPRRKHPRLKEYDYSQSGYYFVTVNAEGNQPLLSAIEREQASAEFKVCLSQIGMIAREQLISLESRYNCVKIDKYIIMPTHIHAIKILAAQTAGASPRPTLTDVVCAFKSLATRLCNRQDDAPGRKIFQMSFYEKIIRNDKNYLEVCEYIEGNPQRWISERDEPKQTP